MPDAQKISNGGANNAAGRPQFSSPRPAPYMGVYRRAEKRPEFFSVGLAWLCRERRFICLLVTRGTNSSNQTAFASLTAKPRAHADTRLHGPPPAEIDCIAYFQTRFTRCR